MLVFHNSNSLYEKPTHESIIKNRQNHVNGVLGFKAEVENSIKIYSNR